MSRKYTNFNMRYNIIASFVFWDTLVQMNMLFLSVKFEKNMSHERGSFGRRYAKTSKRINSSTNLGFSSDCILFLLGCLSGCPCAIS